MSIVMAGITGRRMWFGADTKIQYLEECDDGSEHVAAALGSKITAYELRGGVVVVGYAGMWDNVNGDEQFLEHLTQWANELPADASAGELAMRLAKEFASPMTTQSVVEADARGWALNASEFLIGWYPAASDLELWYVVADHAERLEADVLHAIGGGPGSTMTRRYRRQDEPINADFLHQKLHDVLTRHPSSAYDFPLEIVAVSGPVIGKVQRSYFDAAGEPTTKPSMRVYVPPRLTNGPFAQTGDL
jgi:hypothetical protein